MAHPEDDDTLPSGRALDERVEAAVTTSVQGRARLLREETATGKPTDAPGVAECARLEVSRAGDYKLLDILGLGGFGIVYRAEHVENRTKAAVKIPHADLADDLSTLARFEREIEAVRRLRHPNVVEILDVGRLEDGRPYFVMELLAGASLQDRLQTRGRFSAEEALAVLEPLCSALSTAHAHAVVHRDIKPSNVFLCDLDEAPRVVLLDFGIAKLLDATGPALTSSRAVVGTLSCIAPEQFLGTPIDLRTDVYALGVLLYTMLTGSPPFDDAAGPALRQLLIEGRVPRPSARARVSAALEDVILRAMSRTKDGRHPSVAALLADVRRAVARDSTSGEEASGPARLHALGVYVEVLADPDTLAPGNDELLADFESILPYARAHLSETGFALTVETGTSALFVLPRDRDPARDEEMRRWVLASVLSLHRRLLARPRRDPNVRVHLCIHGGEVFTDDGDAFIGGDLLVLGAWVPERPVEGVFGSVSVLAGLSVAGESILSKAGALLCIAPPDSP